MVAARDRGFFAQEARYARAGLTSRLLRSPRGA